MKHLIGKVLTVTTVEQIEFVKKTLSDSSFDTSTCGMWLDYIAKGIQRTNEPYTFSIEHNELYGSVHVVL